MGRRLLLVALLLGGLLLQSRTQDVAQRGARVRRAELLDSLTLLGHFAGLDRQADLAGSLVDAGDQRVDLAALGKALGALFVAVAAQIGAADERLNATIQLD